MLGHELDMHFASLLLLPFRAFENGGIAAGVVVSFYYVLVVFITCTLVYEIINYVGMEFRVGEANGTKLTVPAHWEWQSRGRAVMRVYVKDYEVLDLMGCRPCAHVQLPKY